MTEQKVRYQVKDFLKDRHPYQPAGGFMVHGRSLPNTGPGHLTVTAVRVSGLDEGITAASAQVIAPDGSYVVATPPADADGSWSSAEASGALRVDDKEAPLIFQVTTEDGSNNVGSATIPLARVLDLTGGENAIPLSAAGGISGATLIVSMDYSTDSSSNGKYTGKVFNGYGQEGIDTLFLALDNPGIDASQKVLALRYLLNHAAGTENKIKFLRKGLVGVLCRACTPSSPAEIAFYTAKLLYAFAVLPQGTHLVIKQGGLGLLNEIAGRTDADAADAAVEALRTIDMLALTWEGRRWLLGKEVARDLELGGMSDPQADGDAFVPAASESLTAATFAVLAKVLENSVTPAEGVKFALDALANLTLEEEGLQHTLAVNGLALTTTVLGRFGGEAEWISEESSPKSTAVLTVQAASTVVWHAGLHASGKAKAMEVPLVPNLGKVLNAILTQTTATKHLALKGSISGAICALMLHPPIKSDSLQALVDVQGAPALVDLVVKMLEAANEAFEPLFKIVKREDDLPEGAPHPEEIKPVMKNCVQAIRLITEFPRATEYLEKALAGEDRTELRRQLYASTAFEHRFGVKPL